MKPVYYLGVVVWLYCPFAFSIILNPTVMTLDIEKKGFAQVIITNNTTARLPLEASAHPLLFDEEGSYQVQIKPATNLMIFPPAAMIDPGQKQAFRVQWSGSYALSSSQSFFVRFAHIQLAYQDAADYKAESDMGVNIQINYNALLHVYTPRQRSQVVLHIDHNGLAQLTNHGDRFAYSKHLIFEESDSTLQASISTLLGERFIAPLTTLVIDSNSTLPAGDYHGRESRL